MRFEHPIAEAEAIIAEDLSDLILTTPRCAARDIAGLSLNVLEPPPVLDPVWATLSIDGVRPRLAALRAEADAARISLGDTLRVTLEWSEPVHMPAPITLRFNSGDTVTFPANDVGATARRAQASFSLSAFPEGGQLRLTGVEPPEALPYDAAGNRVADLEATWLGLVVIPPDGEDLLFDDAHPQALTAAAQLNASSALLKIDDRATITLRFDAPIRPEGLSLRLSVGPLIPLEPVDGAPDLLAGAYTVADGDLTEALTITGVEGQARGLNDQLAEGLEGLVGLGWRFEGEPVAVDGQPPSLIGLDVTLIDGDALIPSLDQPTFGLDLRFDEPIFLESGALSVLLNTAPPSALTLEATAETRRPAPGALDPRPDPRALSLIYRPDVPDIETPNVRALSILAEPDAQGLTDAAGNPLTSLDFEGLNAALEARALTIDTRPPRVIDLEPDTTDAWAEGERHLIHVYFSEPVYLEGTLRLTLNNRAALPLASPTLLGAESADFVYLVGPGQGIDDLQVEGLELTGALTDEGRVNPADLRLEALNLPLGISVLGEDDWRNEGVVDQDAGPTVEPDAARTIQDAAADMHPDDPRRQGGGYGADAVAGTYEEDSGGCHLSGGQPLQAPWAWLLALSLLITRRRLRL
ncbi:hypothetical protein KKB55_05310 [Myxococcota bacterium]|nr:hypothetical protein [Myxococcota bacterium]